MIGICLPPTKAPEGNLQNSFLCQGIQGVCPQREAGAKVKVTRKWLPVGPVHVGWFDYSLEEGGWSRVV